MMNRRQFFAATAATASLVACGGAIAASPVQPVEDYGDPDIEFRNYNVLGQPASGLYHPLREDAEKWYARLGLPGTRNWPRDGRGVSKEILRQECKRWIEARRLGCTYKSSVDAVLVSA
jgi:hypothetical protein